MQRLQKLKECIDMLPKDLQFYIKSLITNDCIETIHMLNSQLCHHLINGKNGNYLIQLCSKIWKILHFIGNYNKNLVQFSKRMRDHMYQTIERYGMNISKKKFDSLIYSFSKLENEIIAYICVDEETSNFPNERNPT